MNGYWNPDIIYLVNLIFNKVSARTIRTLIVMTVLAALCISKNVGLELLPLPISEPTSICNQSHLGSIPNSNSNAPPPAGFISSRVEMTAPRANCADIQLQFESQEPANSTSIYEITETNFLSAQDEHAPSFYDFVFTFRPGGRSPPHFA